MDKFWDVYRNERKIGQVPAGVFTAFWNLVEHETSFLCTLATLIRRRQSLTPLKSMLSTRRLRLDTSPIL
jgi:hypothetical protein